MKVQPLPVSESCPDVDDFVLKIRCSVMNGGRSYGGRDPSDIAWFNYPLVGMYTSLPRYYAMQLEDMVERGLKS